jgi:hypothetical protein
MAMFNSYVKLPEGKSSFGMGKTPKTGDFSEAFLLGESHDAFVWSRACLAFTVLSLFFPFWLAQSASLL